MEKNNYGRIVNIASIAGKKETLMQVHIAHLKQELLV
jgi:short-subunit dehydrogenase